MALIETAYAGEVGTLTLNDPAKRNALSSQLLDELVAALDALRGRARVVILRAQPGSRTWSAGHDVRELPTQGRDPLTYNDPLRLAVRVIQEFPAPIIAMVEGGVWGGACEMAMACDMVIASDAATFAITPAKLGVPYNIGGTLNLIQSVSLPVIKEMLFRARPISAARACEIGLINYVVPAALLESTVGEIVADILRNSPHVIALLKEQLLVLATAHPLNAATYERIQGMRREIYDSADYREGIRAFLEKRPPKFASLTASSSGSAAAAGSSAPASAASGKN
jgi:methylmalonyl-CoA decarboxylase